MKRNLPLRSLFALAALAGPLTACGSDAADPGPAQQPVDTITDTTTADDPADGGSAAIPHPMGADEAVIEIAQEGGFMMIDAVFRQVPQIVISGDGQRFVQGPQIEIYPGPLLPNVLVDEVDEAGIQTLLDLADDHGLLADRVYDQPTNIADAPHTVVTVRANGETFVHRADALGIGIEDGIDGASETGARADLEAFIEEAMSSVTNTPGQTEGVAFEPDTYLVRARPVSDEELAAQSEIEPTFVDWPADASVALADATDCIAAPADEVKSVFESATTLTFFVENDIRYALSVKPLLPGDGC